MGIKKNIAILGSTGSIGTQTLAIVRDNPEMFSITGLAARKMSELFISQVHEFRPRSVSLSQGSIGLSNYDFELEMVDIDSIVSDSDVDIVVIAIPGLAALQPTLTALHHNKTVALASKEVLVVAGDIIKPPISFPFDRLLPLDSEHSAIWQSLRGEDPLGKRLSKLILTASGGPFRGMNASSILGVTPELALNHPTWKMGSKVTIDSATLMNKAFEVIEAHWLFGIEYSDIDVLVHPESIIHSMVEFIDGTLKAQLSMPDMRLPIQYALGYPNRIPRSPSFPSKEIHEMPSLTFEALDEEVFPCFNIGLEAGKAKQTYPAVLNAADEEAVRLFLGGDVPFSGIPDLIRATLEKHRPISKPSLEDILEADAWARNEIRKNYVRNNK
ncbi:MAG: 1-deoxy-D-xylulose-5-phosphate reductoisomerase [Dehalococcoidia bacterium]